MGLDGMWQERLRQEKGGAETGKAGNQESRESGFGEVVKQGGAGQ